MPNNEASEQSVLNSINNSGGLPVIQFSISVYGMTAYPTDKTLSIPGMAADAKETGDAITNLQGAVTDLSLAMEDVESWTADDIKVGPEEDAPTIAEAIENAASSSYPVGTIYMTVSSEEPDFPGTWVEVAITATYTQIKTGKRGYAALGEGETGGDVHFWLRTE